MIRVSILYPNEVGKTFDMNYYAVEQGIAGATPGSKPLYLSTGHLYFNSMVDFLASIGPHVNTLQGDIPNFTNTIAVLHISEVKM